MSMAVNLHSAIRMENFGQPKTVVLNDTFHNLRDIKSLRGLFPNNGLNLASLNPLNNYL